MEDATFWADLDVVRLRSEREKALGSPERGRVIETVFGVRFSNFGSLFTTMSNCPTERLEVAGCASTVGGLSSGGTSRLAF